MVGSTDSDCLLKRDPRGGAMSGTIDQNSDALEENFQTEAYKSVWAMCAMDEFHPQEALVALKTAQSRFPHDNETILWVDSYLPRIVDMIFNYQSSKHFNDILANRPPSHETTGQGSLLEICDQHSLYLTQCLVQVIMLLLMQLSQKEVKERDLLCRNLLLRIFITKEPLYHDSFEVVDDGQSPSSIITDEEDQRLSIPYPILLRTFINCNGFQAYNKRFGLNPWIGCRAAIVHLRPLRIIASQIVTHNVLSSGAGQALVLPICQTLHNQITTLDKELLRREDPESVSILTTEMESMMLPLMSFYAASEVIYRFRLDFALLCLRSEYLDKRLYGLKEMNYLSTQVMEVGQLQGVQNDELPPEVRSSRHWIAPNFMLNFLKSNHVIEEILGKHVHTEVVSRCLDLFYFLSLNDGLHASDLDMLWKASVGKHEGVANEVYKLITKILLMPSCKDEVVLAILECYRTIPNFSSPEVRELGLQLLKVCCKSDVMSKECVEVLWEFLLGDFDDYGKNFSLELIALLLRLRFELGLSSTSYYTEIVKKCVVKLKSGAAVGLLIRLLNSLIIMSETHLEYRSRALVDYMEEEMNILELIIDTICERQSDVAGELEECLGLLATIVKKSSLQISFPQFKKLWDSLIESQQSIFLKWFNALLDVDWNVGISGFSDDTLEKILWTVKKMDPEKLTVAGFFCFNALYVRGIKGYHNAVLETQDDSIDCMWNFFLYSSEDVYKQVSKMIVYVYRANPLATADFMEAIFNRLKIALNRNAATTEAYLPATLRLLQLLYLTLGAYQIRSLRTHEVMSCSLLWKLRIFKQAEVAGTLITEGTAAEATEVYNEFSLEMYNHNWVGTLRRKLLDMLDSSSNSLSISLTSDFSSPLDEDMIPLSQSGMHADCKLYIKLNEAADAPIPMLEIASSATENVENMPQFIVSSNNEYFKILFELLSNENSQVRREVWGIVSRVPTSQSLLVLCSSPPNVPWDSWLSFPSLQSVYYLQIIRYFLCPPEDMLHSKAMDGKEFLESCLPLSPRPQDTDDQEKALPWVGFECWREEFISCGGWNSVVASVASFKSDPSDEAVCLKLYFALDILSLSLEKASDKVFQKSDSNLKDSLFDGCLNLLLKVDNFVNGPEICRLSTAIVSNIQSPALLESRMKRDFLSPLFTIILSNKSHDIRLWVSLLIWKFCEVSSVAFDAVFDHLTKCLAVLPSDSIECGEFFDLFTQVTEVYSKAEGLGDVLLSFLKSLANSSPCDVSDVYLGGVMNLLCSLVRKKLFSEKQCDVLVDLVLESFLICRSSHPLCQADSSRKKAYTFLFSLFHYGPSSTKSLLLKKFISIHESEVLDQWDCNPEKLIKPHHSYSGLQNLGFTCYINSLLQQFFMMPSFREGILDVSVRSESELRGVRHGELLEKLLGETQRVFAFLQFCKKSSYNPSSLISVLAQDNSFFPLDSSVYEQNDANEFFNVLTDRLGSALKYTNTPDLLEKCFGGQLVHQLIGSKSKCHHSSEREEPFFYISLDTKNRPDIYEALDFFVKGEMLQDDNAYFCEKCDCKVSTLKRCCIKDLPETLILHLKRFELDYDTFEKMKINDRFSFPLELDMTPYTAEGVEATKSNVKNEDNIYELHGVLVHSGTAYSGHYYSYIRERDEEMNWFEFNDEDVTPFSASNINSECFGGTYTRSVKMCDGSFENREFAVERNAFMLFYERKNKKSNVVSVIEKQSPPQKRARLSIDAEFIRNKIGELNLKSLPQVLQTEINNINIRVLNHQALLDAYHVKCIQAVMTSAIDNKFLSESIFMALKYFMDLYLRSHMSSAALAQFLDVFKRVISASVENSLLVASVLMQNPIWWKSYIRQCPRPAIRQCFGKVLISVFSNCNVRLLSSVQKKDYASFVEFSISQLWLYLSEAVQERIGVAPSDSSSNTCFVVELLATISGLCTNSQVFRRIAIHQDLVPTLISYYIEVVRDEPGMARVFSLLSGTSAFSNSPGPSTGSDTGAAIISLFANLLDAVQDASQEENIYSEFLIQITSEEAVLEPPSEKLGFLRERDLEFMLQHEFLNRIILDNCDDAGVERLILSLCEISEDISYKVISALIQSILGGKQRNLGLFFKYFEAVLSLQDLFQANRINFGMSFETGLMSVIMRKSKSSSAASNSAYCEKAADRCFKCIVFSMRLTKQVPMVEEWMTENIESWSWIYNWVDEVMPSKEYSNATAIERRRVTSFLTEDTEEIDSIDADSLENEDSNGATLVQTRSIVDVDLTINAFTRDNVSSAEQEPEDASAVEEEEGSQIARLLSLVLTKRQFSI